MTTTTTAEAESAAEEAQPIPTTEEIPDPGTSVEVASPMGSLTLAPDQTALTGEQKAALSAITNANPSEAAAIPHLRVFLHTCQRLALDPWRKQAYLIKRGNGDNAKYTIQVGIDGYRTVAARTRLLHGAATWLWTGEDDDPESWHFDVESGVKRRVWYDEWPESKGYPGAAKAVIKHYDAFGNVVTSDAVAHWKMYAPFYPKFEYQNRQRVPVRDADGKQVMELGEMWEKGPAHMLAKCAEALVLRKVFPDEFAGTVTFEEMHRADVEERARVAREQGAARKEAFAAAKATAAPAATAQPAPAPAEPAEPAETTEPEQSTDDADAGVDEATLRERWLAELAWQAETMEVAVAKMTNRFVKARRMNIEDFPLDALADVIRGFRPVVTEKLRAAHPDQAARYADASADNAGAFVDLPAVLTGAGEPIEEPPLPTAGEGEPEEPVSEPEQPATGEEPTATPEGSEQPDDGPHAFVQDKAKPGNPECQHPDCTFYADDPIHTVADLEGGGR